MKKVRKAVIPVAGLGTRFLPATKAIPKELLPIIDKPVIQYIVEEVVNSGIKEIIFVVSPEKKTLISRHFSRNEDLEKRIKGKPDLLKKLKATNNLAKFSFVIQKKPLGDGHAILCAKHLIKDEPFAVLFGDDIIDSHTPALAQLLKVHEKEHCSVVCLEKVPRKDTCKYGIIKPGKHTANRYDIISMVEKPTPAKAPSLLGIIGKYIVTPEVLDALKKARAGCAGKNGELRLIDGLKLLLKKQKILGVEVHGKRFDTGNKDGFVKAIKHFSSK
ncbi:MAG: UTP--glucose-1-phosphate uridylyltransferase [Patescibacteria group bacterium]|nr:UTP--glucose-1-phosphate uridylyltransferase [Patescibacteria group bacterium]